MNLIRGNLCIQPVTNTEPLAEMLRAFDQIHHYSKRDEKTYIYPALILSDYLNDECEEQMR